MFSVALIIGLYSYSIFFLGVLHLLTQQNIVLVSLLFAPVFIYQIRSSKLPKINLFLFLILLQLTVNLIGALGPELGFDALWYHLTLPKIWLQQHTLSYIPGSQFKYSVMPMLAEMWYFIFPGKLVHYLFGVLTLIATYKISRSYLAVLILVGNLVFSWEQTSAYIDLARAFFEIMALYMLTENKIYKSALMLGLAVSTKLLSLISIPIFFILLLFKKSRFVVFFLIVILTVSPWLVRAYIATGNPIYPFLSPMCCDTKFSPNPIHFFDLFTRSPDPISPIYILTLPLLLVVNFKDKKSRIVAIYSLLSLVVWIITPNLGGARFILPYLPAISITTAFAISQIPNKFAKQFLTAFVVLISLSSIFYRIMANVKYFLPKEQLLARHLDFGFGDYYDFDHFFKPADRVLPIGINNLYYLNAQIALPGENYDYILSRPPVYKNWKPIFQNAITNTAVYERPD